MLVLFKYFVVSGCYVMLKEYVVYQIDLLETNSSF